LNKNLLAHPVTSVSFSPQGCHLAFLEQFAGNNIHWPFGHLLLFSDFEVNSSIFFAYFGKISIKIQHSSIYLTYFGTFSFKIETLFGLSPIREFETVYGQKF
jgi:hypothetical protein